MSKLLAVESFLSWIGKNGDRFSHKPDIMTIRSESLSFGLLGVIPEICCTLSFYEIEVHAFYKGDHWDILQFFDMPEIDLEMGGYYCRRCDSTRRRFYPSGEDLFAEHCFEPLLQWVNKAFHERCVLCFFKIPGGKWAKVLDSDLLSSDGDARCLVQSIPALIRLDDPPRGHMGDR